MAWIFHRSGTGIALQISHTTATLSPRGDRILPYLSTT